MGILGTLAGGAAGGFETGTKIVFQQTAAPTGWTKDTSHNDKALRVVSGTASSGGTDSFTTTFGSGKSTQSHTLTTPQIPAHGHSVGQTRNSGNTNPLGRGAISSPTTAINTGNAGGGGSHSHNLSLDIAYVDTIIATKD